MNNNKILLNFYNLTSEKINYVLNYNMETTILSDCDNIFSKKIKIFKYSERDSKHIIFEGQLIFKEKINF